MKLTDEQLEFIKKWMAKCEEKDEIPTNGMTIGRLLEHIEALQQANEQLQAQVAQYREAVEEATETIENIYEKDTPQTEKYRDILNVGTTEYHNPADAALLQSQEQLIRQYCKDIAGYLVTLAKAREALKSVSFR